MVQIHNLGPSRKSLLQNALGQSLGQGLSNFTNQYFAGKALDDVINNPSYRDSPMGERASRLQRAMMPYGEMGASVLQNRMQVEQQVAQEKEQKKQESLLRARTKAENKYVSGGELTPEEEELVRPELRVSYLKAKQPKGGLTGQPVPPEVAQAIPQILNANKDANADELAVALDQAGIPRAFSNSYIENRRRQDEASQKLPNLKQELGVKRDAELLADADKHRALIPTEEASLNAMEDAITEGDQSFFSWDNLAERTGFEWARTAKGGQFKTAAKTFLINNVTKFGARPNQYIEQQIADSLAKVGRDAEANLASIALTRFDTDVKKRYMELVDKIEEEGNYAPGTLGKEAQKQMGPIVEQMQKELSNKLHILASHDSLGQGEVYVYDKDGNIVGTINQDEAGDLPEGYHVE